ncbi:FeoA family protein [Vallitaleaceae bacterium 9-2]|mgnify:FL=1
MKLYDGKKSHTYEVNYIEVDPKTKKHLQNMGITQGVKIKIMSQLGGHAYVLRVRGSRVALSENILRQIDVNEVTKENLMKERKH